MSGISGKYGELSWMTIRGLQKNQNNFFLDERLMVPGAAETRQNRENLPVHREIFP